MSPVAPMPQGAPVGTNGLKVWVIVDSGELSITRVFPVAAEPVLEPVVPELVLLDEHAASPAASKPAAPTAKSRLWLCILLISLVFLSWIGGCIGGGWVIGWFHFRAARRPAPGRRRPGASRPRRVCR